MAVLYIDLNDFKTMNDIHGHKVGDHALKLIARRMAGSIRAQDHTVRLGGDEFICIILDDAPEAAARAMSERLLLACNTPIRFGAADFNLSPAMGIAVAKPGMTWEMLLGQADTAMFQAKRCKQRTAILFQGDSEPAPQKRSAQGKRLS
jgi:diguanylate cyclase (GGDEF)-like protein